MAEHEPCIGATDDWYTPRDIFDALGLTFEFQRARLSVRRRRAWWATCLCVARTPSVLITCSYLAPQYAGFCLKNFFGTTP